MIKYDIGFNMNLILKRYNDRMKIKKIYKLLALEVIALSAILAYFLISSSDIYRWYVGSTSFVKQNRDCDLHKSTCSVKLKDGSIISLSINPKEIPLKKPIKLTVTTQGIKTKTLSLKVFAVNMNMGLIEKSLKKIKKNTYEGEVILPTCVVGDMIWNANIIADKTSKSVGAIFEFQTKK